MEGLTGYARELPRAARCTAFRDRLAKGTVDEARDALRTAGSLIDKTAQYGVIHKNTAARTKSRLNAALVKREAAGS